MEDSSVVFMPASFMQAGAHGEQARGVDFRGHVRELPLYGLEFADGLAELLALL